MRLSEADFSFIRTMRSVGVFQDTIPDRLPDNQRFVACQCGDGHRVGDWLKHLEGNLCHNAELIHLVKVNGGALNLGPHSPLANRNNLPHDLVCLANIEEGCKIKDTKVVLLGIHFPCGMAVANSLSPKQALEHLFDGKHRLRTRIEGVRPIPLVHVDYGNRFRTYFVDRKTYELWNQRDLAASQVA